MPTRRERTVPQTAANLTALVPRADQELPITVKDAARFLGVSPASIAHPVGAPSPHASERAGQLDVAGVSKVLNLAEAAALVRCSRAHLSNIINGKVRGIPHLPILRIGRRVLFRRESLELWLQRVETASPARTQR